MLYDDRVKKAVADALRDGFTGEALTVRVGKQFEDEYERGSKALQDLMTATFIKIVHKAAADSDKAAKAKAKAKTSQPKLSM